MADADRPAAASSVPERVRLPLLTLITQQSLDEDYLHAAERRAAGDLPLRRAGGARTAALVTTVIAAFGLLVSVAFVQTSRGADAADASRQGLIQRVETRRDRVARLTERSARLTDQNRRLTTRLTRLTGIQQDIAGGNRRLQVGAGFVPVSGPGIRVTFSQPADVDEDHAIQDSDLALLVNALWSAGADAIAVNGQRITARTAIRASGVAILVNKVGVAPPYVVSAIGDEGSLQARFVETTSGQIVSALAQQFGFTLTMQNEDRLNLPSGPGAFLSLGSARQSAGSDGDTPPRGGDSRNQSYQDDQGEEGER